MTVRGAYSERTVRLSLALSIEVFAEIPKEVEVWQVLTRGQVTFLTGVADGRNPFTFS